MHYTAVLSIGVVLSPAIAPVLGAYLSHLFGWQSCFWFSAVFGAALLLVLMRVLPETISERQALPGTRSMISEYLVFMRSRDYMLALSIMALNYAAYFAFITMSSYIYINILALDPRLFSKLFLVMAGAYLLGNYVMRWLNNARIQVLKITLYGLIVELIGGVLGVVILVSHDRMVTIVLLSLSAAIVRLGYAMLNAPLQVYCMNRGLGRAGIAVGIQYLVLFLFGSLGSMLVSLFHQQALTGTVGVVLALIAVSFVAWFTISQK